MKGYPSFYRCKKCNDLLIRTKLESYWCKECGERKDKEGRYMIERNIDFYSVRDL